MAKIYVPRPIIEPPADLDTLPLSTYHAGQTLAQQRYMPLYVHQLFQSTTWARCQKNTFLTHHYISLWGRLFLSSPPGTLANDWDALEAAAGVKLANSRHQAMLRELLPQNLQLVRIRPKPLDIESHSLAATASVHSPCTVRDVSVQLPSLVLFLAPVIAMIETSRTKSKRYEQKQKDRAATDGKTTVRQRSVDGQQTVGQPPEGNRIESLPPSSPPKKIEAPEKFRPDRTDIPAWMRTNEHGFDGLHARMSFVMRRWAKAHLAAFSRAYEPIPADWDLLARWIAEDQHDTTDLAECLAFAAGQMAGRGFAPRSMAPLQADVDAEFIEILEGSNGKRRFGRKYDGRPGPHVADAERPPGWRKADEYYPNRGQVIDLNAKKPKTDLERMAEAMSHIGDESEDLAEG